jgi:hypothetical protein
MVDVGCVCISLRIVQFVDLVLPLWVLSSYCLGVIAVGAVLDVMLQLWGLYWM